MKIIDIIIGITISSMFLIGFLMLITNLSQTNLIIIIITLIAITEILLLKRINYLEKVAIIKSLESKK